MSSVRDLDFEWSGLRLTGALHLPTPAESMYPAVVFMQGSGPADRDADGYFVPIRDALLGHGFAVYSFDKAGCGSSDGDWRDHDLSDRAAQVVAALERLRAQPETDPVRVGVWGQSQGGWMAQILAADSPELAFAIVNSGPSFGVREQNIYGCEHTMRAAGHSDGDIERALEHIHALYGAAEQGMDFATARTELLEPVEGESWYGYMAVEGPSDWGFGLRLLEEAYDPLEALRRARVPVLAVFGGRDVLVPAWRSARETGEALAAAPTTDTAVVVFPEADHRIRVSDDEFAPGYLDLLADWAIGRV